MERGRRRIAAFAACLAGCGAAAPDARPLLDPAASEPDLRRALGVPAGAERVLILSQSSHLDIDWKQTFAEYYEGEVEGVLDDAGALLDDDPAAFYSVAEMAYLARQVDVRGADAWRRQLARGHARIVGGGLTSPDTLLPTAEPLIRDYLYGAEFAATLGARARAAWLPDSFGHVATLPDLLSAAGFDAVGFGRIDGARHSYEVLLENLPPIAPGDSTAATLRDLGSADFVWRGPGGGELVAHAMPVREYCQGDDIDLLGYALGGERIGSERDDEPNFVVDRIAGYVDELAPYARTPYLFVPVGCDFQRPRPRLTTYARWWNDARFAASGVWVAPGTFEDYMKLVAFHRDALPVLARDLAPVWTGFYASRPRVKQAARAAAEALAGVEPFLVLAGRGVDGLADAWRAVVLADHHDAITGTSSDRVVTDEELPALAGARADAERAWESAAAALAGGLDTRDAPAGDLVTVFNPAPVDASGVVEIAHAGAGPWHAVAGAEALPAQPSGDGKLAFVAGDVPAFGWRTYALAPGVIAGATATLDGDRAHLDTGNLVADLVRHDDGWSLDALAVRGRALLAGPSLEWVVYADSGGLYRIGSERPDCKGARFTEAATVRLGALALVEAGPARVRLRATTTVDGLPTTIELEAAAGADHLTLHVTGAAARGRTVALRLRPAAPGDTLAMGVAGGVAVRPRTHRYTPSLWPAVTWASRGALVAELTQATAVFGDADGALEWVAFRNATTEKPCDDLGPSGTEDGALTITLALGARDDGSDGTAELAASIALVRGLRAVVVGRHGGTLPSSGRLLGVDAPGAVATSLKPATRGGGLVLHLVRPGAATAHAVLRRGLLPWSGTSRPDLLERDDVAFGTPVDGGVALELDAALTAVRLRAEAR